MQFPSGFGSARLPDAGNPVLSLGETPLARAGASKVLGVVLRSSVPVLSEKKRSTGEIGLSVIRNTFFTVLIILIPVSICMAQHIRIPSSESIRQDLAAGSDNEYRINRALLTIQMYRLPWAETLQPLCSADQTGAACAAYLAAGGNPEVVLSLLHSPEVIENDRQISVVVALLTHEQTQASALQTLVPLALDGDRQAVEIVMKLGGRLSRQAVPLLLDQISQYSSVGNLDADHELYSLSRQLRLTDWPALQRLLQSPYGSIRFLSSLWVVSGDFDDLPISELEALSLHAVPVLQAAGSVLRVRRQADNAAAVHLLKSSLHSSNSDARRMALAGILTLTENQAEWLDEVLPLLLNSDEAVAETALKVVSRWADQHTPRIAQFVETHFEQFPAGRLRKVVFDLNSETPGLELIRLWIRLGSSPDFRVREQVMFQLSRIPPAPDVAEVLLAGLNDPLPAVRIEALEAFTRFKITGEMRTRIIAAAERLLQDQARDSHVMAGSSVGMTAASLLWKLDAFQPEIFAREKKLLTSDDKDEVGDGVRLLRTLKENAAPFLPMIFELACENDIYYERIAYEIRNLRSVSMPFLVGMLQSSDPHARGTALQLLAQNSPDGHAIQACLPLLNDDATVAVHHLFSTSKESISRVAASLLAIWARRDPALGKRLQSDDMHFPQLQTLLSPKQLKWITAPRPTFQQIVSSSVQPTYWDLYDMFSELESGVLWGRRDSERAGQVPPELMIEFFELSARVWPMFYDTIQFVPEDVFDGLLEKSTVDERLIPVLESWLTESPLLDLDFRTQVAAVLIHFRPDNAPAQRYLRLARRDFGRRSDD